MFKSTILFLISFVVFACGDIGEEQSPRLLISKQVLNRYLVESKDIELKYTVYNIGTAAAVNVQLADNSFNPEAFDVVGGHLQVRFDRIVPQANVSHVVIVRPLKSGYFNFTSAEVTYQSAEDSPVQVSFSSEPGEGGIVAFRDYDKKFSSHSWDWLAFTLMTIPSLAIPLALWHGSKSKYEKLVKPSKKTH